MSLVGPRPEEESVVALYDERQRGRLAIKPGMTGPMQVYGRSDLTFEERLAMERDYLDNLSLLTDLAILLRTPRAIIRGDGAYSGRRPRCAHAPTSRSSIVSHGAEALLRRCLRSLREHPPAAAEMRVTVVDSGSPDGTPDMVEREFPEVRLLRRGNIGFSAANNLVLRESEAAAVLLLNPDTEVYAGTLDAALARLALGAADRAWSGSSW